MNSLADPPYSTPLIKDSVTERQRWAADSLSIILIAVAIIDIATGEWLEVSGRYVDAVEYVLCSVLAVWTVFIAKAHFIQFSNEPVRHRRFTLGDHARWFMVLLLSWDPVAERTEQGFLLHITASIATMTAFLVAGMGEKAIHKREKEVPSLLILVAAAYGIMLGCGALNGVRKHYGVPLLGHFFQRPVFDARYKAELLSKSAGGKHQEVRGSADIHVERCWWPMGTGWQNKVTIIRIYNPSDLEVRQEERLEEDRFIVEDDRGDTWQVILKEPLSK